MLCFPCVLPHPSWQELGFEVIIRSAADTSQNCRDFVQANFPVEHLYASVEDQLSGCPCILHAKDGITQCSAGTSDVAVFGSVCTPYSRLRAKRFASGSVKAISNMG